MPATKDTLPQKSGWFSLKRMSPSLQRLVTSGKWTGLVPEGIQIAKEARSRRITELKKQHGRNVIGGMSHILHLIEENIGAKDEVVRAHMLEDTSTILMHDTRLFDWGLNILVRGMGDAHPDVNMEAIAAVRRVFPLDESKVIERMFNIVTSREYAGLHAHKNAFSVLKELCRTAPATILKIANTGISGANEKSLVGIGKRIVSALTGPDTQIGSKMECTKLNSAMVLSELASHNRAVLLNKDFRQSVRTLAFDKNEEISRTAMAILNSAGVELHDMEATKRNIGVGELPRDVIGFLHEIREFYKERRKRRVVTP